MVSPRPTLISGNWKMNETHFEALKLIQELAALFRATSVPTGREVSVHPPHTSLRTVQVAIETDRIPLSLGAQTCHFADKGAFTGEVSAEMLAKLDVAYVIVGHSERRTLFGESDEIVRKKIDAVFRAEMTPIVCVGENATERAEGNAIAVVRDQLRSALSGRADEVIERTVVAYEPLWAIGTGVTATSTDAQDMAGEIRAELTSIAGEVAARVRIQYGGSVTPESAGELLSCGDIDGLLVGGASLDPNRFAEIVWS